MSAARASSQGCATAVSLAAWFAGLVAPFPARPQEAAEIRAGEPSAVSSTRPLDVRPVFQIEEGGVRKGFETGGAGASGTKPAGAGEPLFFAVAAEGWPAGLVPLFAVEARGQVELRRRPPRGLENFTEPLCFVLPPAEDRSSARFSGHWQCKAVRGDGSEVGFAWDLAVEADQVSGRFDQGTEYRFADITGGTLRSNRIELQVQHIMDGYVLSGEWREGRMKGEWRKADGEERGTWEASRRAESAVADPAEAGTAPLFEWSRENSAARRYTVGEGQAGPGWTRSSRPLGRVWQRASAGPRAQPDR